MLNPSHPGPYLQKLREIAGMSVEDAALAAGTSAEYLSQVERVEVPAPAGPVTERISHAIAAGLLAYRQPLRAAA